MLLKTSFEVEFLSRFPTEGRDVFKPEALKAFAAQSNSFSFYVPQGSLYDVKIIALLYNSKTGAFQLIGQVNSCDGVLRSESYIRIIAVGPNFESFEITIAICLEVIPFV